MTRDRRAVLIHRGNRAASTAGALLRAVLETPAFVAGIDDLAMMGEPVEQGRGHPGNAEHLGPFAEGEATIEMRSQNRLIR